MASSENNSNSSGFVPWLRSTVLEAPEDEEKPHKKETWVRPFQIILVVGYFVAVIVWFVVVKRGYQSFEAPIGSTIIKLKGTGLAVAKNVGYPQEFLERQSIWDPAEYSIPPMENNAFFIITRALVTSNQREDTCATALSDKLFCDEDNTTVCQNDIGVNDRGGILTGKCVRSTEDAEKKVCEIRAWCPVENSKSLDYRLNRDAARNFTAFIKTVVSFSNADTVVRTVKDEKFNQLCRFNASDKLNKKCPIFSVGYMIDNLKAPNGSFTEAELFEKGGLILIEQKWDCNLDTNRSRTACFPTHIFQLLQGADDVVSPGINYRFVTKGIDNRGEYRTLRKVYGIRFILVITGRGGKFDIVELSTTIQGNLAMITVIAVVCALILKLGYTCEEQRNTLKEGLRTSRDILCGCYKQYRRQRDDNGDAKDYELAQTWKTDSHVHKHYEKAHHNDKQPEHRQKGAGRSKMQNNYPEMPRRNSGDSNKTNF